MTEDGVYIKKVHCLGTEDDFEDCPVDWNTPNFNVIWSWSDEGDCSGGFHATIECTGTSRSVCVYI